MTTQQAGQYKFDDRLNVTVVASSATERGKRESQGDLFLSATEATALAEWASEHNTDESPEDTR